MRAANVGARGIVVLASTPIGMGAVILTLPKPSSGQPLQVGLPEKLSKRTTAPDCTSTLLTSWKKR